MLEALTRVRHNLGQTGKRFPLGLDRFGVTAFDRGLLVAGIVKRTPQVWICFGLVAVISLVILFHAYEQTYKDEGWA
jgi:hypothetical protein